MSERCPGCGHVAHRGACRGKAPSGCVPLDLPGGGFACYRGQRPPCPCPYQTCRCGVPVLMAAAADDPGIVVPVLRDPAWDPAGRLAVRHLADGTLSVRDLAPGGQLHDGEWRGTEHDGPCQKIHGPGWTGEEAPDAV
jgi:hypothetical protein